MNKHPSAGFPVKIVSGPYKDKYFIVIDFIVNQFQGKSMAGIAKFQPNLIDPVVKRIGRLDDQIVFGRLHPTMEFICMHDSELIVKPVEVLPDNVVSIKQGVKNDTRRSNQGNSEDSSPGSAESIRCPVLSSKDDAKVIGSIEEQGQADSDAGGANLGPSEERTLPRKSKPRNPSKGGGGDSKDKE